MKTRVALGLQSVLFGCLMAFPSGVLAQTGYSITGGMSNFDINNHTDEPCDECEVEIEGIHPEDVVHCYSNSNYGAPTVTLRDDGLATIIDYRNPQHLTAVNSVEHFGISLRAAVPGNACHVRWMRSMRPATVNGQVPSAGGGSGSTTTHAVQPMLPSINAEMGFGPEGESAVICTVSNNDPMEAIWIKRRALVTTGTVTLEALMPNNPVVTSTIEIDAAPVMLAPGDAAFDTSDLVEVEENQTVVFAAQYFQDVVTTTEGGGPFGGGPVTTHAAGPELGNVMTASLASAEGGCDAFKPAIIEQPQSVDAALNHSVNVRVNADGNDMDLSYQWMKDGLPLTNNSMYSGVNGDELSIEHLTAATEGFYSVRIWNGCGENISQSALVFITGHNVAPPRPPVCVADLGSQGGTAGQDGLLDNNDFIVFIDYFFSSDPAADLGSQGGIAGADQFWDNNDFVVFIDRFFSGCP